MVVRDIKEKKHLSHDHLHPEGTYSLKKFLKINKIQKFWINNKKIQISKRQSYLVFQLPSK